MVFSHDIEQFHEAEAGGGDAEGHHGPFFGLVLLDGILVEMCQAELNEFPVLFKELRDIEILPAFIRLLIEVDGPDAILIIFYIGGDIHYKVIGPHVAEEPDEAAFVEFYELLCEADLVGLRIVEKVADEQIAGDAGDMFFDEGVMVGIKRDAVGREQMFQFETVDAGCIGLLYVIVIVIVVELIDDADAKGVGVGEGAEVDAGDVEVFGIAEIAFRLQDGIHLDESFADKIPVAHVVEGGFPESVLIVLVAKRNGLGDMV